MAEHVRTPTNKPMKVTDVNTECELRNNNGLTTSLLVSLTLTPLCWLRLLSTPVLDTRVQFWF